MAGQRGGPVWCVSSVWTHGAPSPGRVGEHQRAGARDAGLRTVSFPPQAAVGAHSLGRTWGALPTGFLRSLW